MLYLAQVQKHTRFLSRSQTKLKLLAYYEQKVHFWKALFNDELITAETATNFTDGVLVLVDMTDSRQVQQIKEAASALVSILTNLSCKLEKMNAKEEEIKQWKHSLVYVSDDLNFRHMEILEWRQQIQEEFARLERARLEIDQERRQLEIERLELEKATQNLRNPQREPRLDDATLGGQNQRV